MTEADRFGMGSMQLMRRTLTALFIAAIFAMAVVPLASAADITSTVSGVSRAGETVRVGWYTEGSFSCYSPDGLPSGYAYDYLMAIGQYAGWNYEFVDAPLSDCISMLQSGQVDIVPGLIHTAERDRTIGFTTQSMGMTLKYLLVKPGSRRYAYEDFAAFDGMVIGVTSGNAGITSLVDFAAKGGFSYSTREYATQEALYDALDSGAVDAIMADNTQSNRDADIIAAFGYAPLYMATAQGNTALIDRLDDNITQVGYYYPTFTEDLYGKYFRENSTSSPVFTTEELDYLENNPQITVYYDPEWYPLEYLDRKTGSYNGIVPDVLELVSQKSGLTFVPTGTDDSADSIAVIGPGMGDAVASMICDFGWADRRQVLISQPILQCSMTRVTANRDYADLRTAALIRGDFIAECVSELYPDLAITYYDGVQEALDAVLRGSQDCTFLTAFETDYYLSVGRYSRLSYRTVDTFENNLCLCMGRDCDPRLFTIISKSLSSITSAQRDAIIHENTDKNRQVTLIDLVYLHPMESIFVISLILVLIAAGIFFMYRSHRSRRENVELAAANAAKTDFLSRMSHDMRTPMNAVLGLSELTLGIDDLTPEVADNLRKIRSSSEYLLVLINDTLDMNRIERSEIELNLEPVELAGFMNGIKPIIQPRADERHITLSITRGDMTVRGIIADRLRLQQILMNLLSNAIKFTPEGGRVDLVFRQLSAGDGTVTIEAVVRDTGIGMSEEFLPNLFEPFEQEHDSKVKVGEGSGLGLAIVKSLVELMGGTITAVSRKGEGSEFTVRIPFTVAGDGELVDIHGNSMASETDGYDISGTHVLLAEDHPINAEISRELLERAGCSVTHATDGRETVRMFSEAPIGSIDIVLMDIQMPEMNGLDATRAIRVLDREDAAITPIVAMTANAFDEDIRNSEAAGMDAHLAKPVDVKELYRTIASLTGRNRRKGEGSSWESPREER